MSDDTTQPADEVEVRNLEDLGEPEIDESKSSPADRETAGPFDVSEVPSMRPYVDLGAIKVAPREGLQMRLEVEERTKRVVAVTLEYAESVLQVQAFSAPKSSGLWNRVRDEIASQFGNQGARVHIEDGLLGPELVTESPVPAEQGGGTRPVRFFAVDGPRWMLRGVLMGKGAVDADARAMVLEVFREMVVVRGDQPMPPSELLPLKVPAGVAQGATGGATQA